MSEKHVEEKKGRRIGDADAGRGKPSNGKGHGEKRRGENHLLHLCCRGGGVGTQKEDKKRKTFHPADEGKNSATS